MSSQGFQGKRPETFATSQEKCHSPRHAAHHRHLLQLGKLLRVLHHAGLHHARVDLARLHLARAIARRAERSLAALAETEPVNSQALVYMNRLSDLLFVLARRTNEGGRADILWQPGLTAKSDG